jgi:hypothetical protein
MERRVRVIQGEKKPLNFLVYQNNRLMDMGDCEFLLTISPHYDDAAPMIVKQPSQFNVAYAPLGSVSVDLDHGDTVVDPGVYKGQLRLVDVVTGNIRKTLEFDFEVLPSLDKIFLMEAGIQATTETSEVELDIL